MIAAAFQINDEVAIAFKSLMNAEVVFLADEAKPKEPARPAAVLPLPRGGAQLIAEARALGVLAANSGFADDKKAAEKKAEEAKKAAEAKKPAETPAPTSNP